ncbi:MAG TPA: hypothetical protein VIU15_37480, partial [Streptomyces sp.]
SRPGKGDRVAIAELQVYSVEEADVTGGVCVVRCLGGVARTGQVYAVGELRERPRRPRTEPTRPLRPAPPGRAEGTLTPTPR